MKAGQEEMMAELRSCSVEFKETTKSRGSVEVVRTAIKALSHLDDLANVCRSI